MLWSMVHRAWCMEYGAWSMEHGVCIREYGVRIRELLLLSLQRNFNLYVCMYVSMALGVYLCVDL